MLANLVPKLRIRFGNSAAECGADSSEVEKCQDVSTDLLMAVLEDARIEYSTYKPIEDTISTVIPVHNPVIILPYEPFAVTGVYVSNNYPFGAPITNSPYLARWYADPALARVDDIYADYHTPEATYIRNGNKIRITSIFNTGARVEVHVHRMRNWNEINEWDEVIILKLALIKLIDNVTTSGGGLIRIPVPTGYFEFDGGRVMQNLRSKLEVETYRVLQSRTPGITQG